MKRLITVIRCKFDILLFQAKMQRIAFNLTGITEEDKARIFSIFNVE